MSQTLLNKMKDTKNCATMRDYVAHFANPVRMKILCRLLGGKASVGELVEACGEKQSTVSQQLKYLYMVEFLARERKGSRVFYRISRTSVKKTMRFLGRLSEQIIEEAPGDLQ